jgi:sugar phosphate isomerase/epimerase
VNQPAIQIGLNARLFPSNWRPARQEIEFAASGGFQAIQFPGPEHGLDAERLGDDFPSVAEALRQANLAPVMEMLIRVDAQGRTGAGATPLEVLRANLPAISGLGCRYVHIHLVPAEEYAAPILQQIEAGFVDGLAAGVALAQQHGFRLGFEHNEPRIGLCSTPEVCAHILAAVPDLGLVWDLNHTIPAHLAGFLGLAERMTMLHVSDTPLPTVNYHLPLGLGSVDFAAYLGALQRRHFSGPAILEIGGLPQSGGYGRDTDAALLDSLDRLRRAMEIGDQ